MHYHVLVPSTESKAALDLLLDLVLDPALEQDSFSMEREVVLEEPDARGQLGHARRVLAVDGLPVEGGAVRGHGVVDLRAECGELGVLGGRLGGVRETHGARGGTRGGHEHDAEEEA